MRLLELPITQTVYCDCCGISSQVEKVEVCAHCGEYLCAACSDEHRRTAEEAAS